MTPLDSKLLQKLLDAAAETLDGEWLLLGGTLLPALGVDTRPTVDVDLVSLEKSSNEQSLKLMALAESLHLPVETINQAAAYFLEKAGYTRGDLIVLKKGRRATLYRPSVTLFWKLKISRLSESDLSDCLHYLKFSRNRGELVEVAVLNGLVEKALQERPTADRAARLTELKRQLTG
ncbi:MAG: hypothetical protein KGQ59_11640, partial [Bdellovibrionales bacterium]|nr:hypothetical protein [Bdellovibrionales bacterium]